MVRLTSLPPSLLARVLDLLPLRDRCTAMLVCRHFQRVGEDPLLWAEVLTNTLVLPPRPPLPQVSPPRCHLPSALLILLSQPRLVLLRTLNLQNLKIIFTKPLIATLLKYVAVNTNLALLDLSSSDLSNFPAFPFSETFSKIHVLRLSNARLSSEQMTSLLTKIISVQPRKTQELDVSFNNLGYLDADLIVQAVKTLRSFSLGHTELNKFVTPEIVRGVANSKLEELDLSGCSLEHTSLDCLGLNQHLSHLSLAEVIFDPEKMDSIITNLSLVHNIRRLNLSRTVLTR